LKIGLNATCFNDRPSGAKQRFIGIYGELIKRMSDAEFVIYEPSDCSISPWFEHAENVTYIKTPIPSEGRIRKYISGMRYWRSALANENIDIFEQFNFPIVKSPTGKTLLTVHDLRWVDLDSWNILRTVHSRIIKRSIKAADHIVTVSEAMKDVIRQFFSGVPVSVIYNGLNAESFNTFAKEEVLAVSSRYKLPERFILAVGHLEPRKNYLRLVEAISILRDEGHHLHLVIIGNDSGERNKIEEKIGAENLVGLIKIISGLTNAEVRCIYEECSLVVFPSVYEGFGIPILEAMAAERPIILSNIPVFREITRDKYIYFSSDRVDEMVLTIKKVLLSDSEKSRLVEYGRQRVKEFDFKSISTKVEELYSSVLSDE